MNRFLKVVSTETLIASNESYRRLDLYTWSADGRSVSIAKDVGGPLQGKRLIKFNAFGDITYDIVSDEHENFKSAKEITYDYDVNGNWTNQTTKQTIYGASPETRLEKIKRIIKY